MSDRHIKFEALRRPPAASDIGLRSTTKSSVTQSEKMGGCDGHSHDHDHEDEMGVSLQQFIDVPRSYCLNEHQRNAGQSILKPFADRFSLTPSLQSPREDDDPELLFHITFTEAVSIKFIAISGIASIHVPNGDESQATSAPHSVKVFANRTDLDFDTARDLEPTATLELVPPEHMAEHEEPEDELRAGSLDYPLRPASKFKYCTSLTLFFEDNFASNSGVEEVPTEIIYVGFKGSGTKLKRQAVEAVYESRGMKKDHKTPGADYGMSDNGGAY